jgi:hypothetical protein
MNQVPLSVLVALAALVLIDILNALAVARLERRVERRLRDLEDERLFRFDRPMTRAERNELVRSLSKP